MFPGSLDSLLLKDTGAVLKTDVTPVTVIVAMMTTSMTTKTMAMIRMMMSHGIVMVMMNRSMSFKR